MKSLSTLVFEALFSTNYAPGETIQFRPLTSYAEQFGLKDDVWYIGVVNALKIDRRDQWYFINYNGVEIGPIHSLNVKQDANQIFTNESFKENVLESFIANLKIGENVSFYPMYRQQQDLGISAEEMTGQIVSVKFTKAKVFYSIVDDYHGKLFDDVDSSNVWKPIHKQLPEA